MEDMGARHCLDAADFAAMGVGTRVATRRQHHQHGDLITPTRHVAGQASMRGGIEQCEQVRLQAQHQHLAFRITETHIELDQLRPLRGQHEPGEQHA